MPKITFQDEKRLREILVTANKVQEIEKEFFIKKILTVNNKGGYPLTNFEESEYIRAFDLGLNGYGLSFNPSFGELSIYPQGQSIVCSPMWKGYLRLIDRAGIGVVKTNFVTEKEAKEMIIDDGLSPVFSHKIDPLRKESEWVMFYCMIRYPDGNFHLEIIDKGKYEKLSKMGKVQTIWQSFPIEMGRKSAFLAARKYLNISMSNENHKALITAIDIDANGMDFLQPIQEEAQIEETQEEKKPTFTPEEKGELGKFFRAQVAKGRQEGIDAIDKIEAKYKERGVDFTEDLKMLEAHISKTYPHASVL